MQFRELDKLNLAEVHQLAGLIRQSQKYQRVELDGDVIDEADMSRDIETHITRSLERPGHTYLLAEDEGSVAGFIHLQAVPSKLMYVEDLYVDPLRREHGAASGLLEAAEAKAREYGLDRLRLAVHQKNASAHQMYLKAGFHQVESTYLDLEKTLESSDNIDISGDDVVYEYDVEDRESNGL